MSAFTCDSGIQGAALSLQTPDNAPGFNPDERPSAAKEARFSQVTRSNILFFFAVLLALLLAWQMLRVLRLVYVSALFAVVLMPLVRRIQSVHIRGWSPNRAVAIAALMTTAIASVTTFLVLGLPPVIHDLQHFAADLPQRIAAIVSKLKELPIADQFGVDTIADRAQSAISSFARYLFASIPMWMSHIVGIITAVVLCVYFMLEGEPAYNYFMSFVPASERTRLGRTLKAAEARMSKWLLGQGSLMLILGITSTIVFGILHVRYFFMLGVLMGLFNIIPVIGGIVTIALVAGAAALDSWTKMAGVLIFYLIYVQVENAYITPRIMRTRVNLMGLAVLIALLAGSTLAGIVGTLVAVPTAALVAVFMDEYLVQPDSRTQVSEMREEA